MEIISWNCRGLCNDVSMQALRTLIQQKCHFIIFLCETKIRNKDYMCNFCFRLGYLTSEAVLSDGQYGGLAMFWRDGLGVHFRSKSNHHIDVEIQFDARAFVCWRLAGFYGHPTTVKHF